MGTVYKVAGLA